MPQGEMRPRLPSGSAKIGTCACALGCLHVNSVPIRSSHARPKRSMTDQLAQAGLHSSGWRGWLVLGPGLSSPGVRVPTRSDLVTTGA
ncbi:hypothetical protein K458DRAFT_99331 [Lentithecium fluviatile CBS 122367]|uniref:Uncharacterized protein n=1 Tax=Lentithecium fluviatile CBS 122367 TaxID=1168545 RepID=A0A6G1JJ23_9PLEO|nr:hypothetical protein K458DRAFT_99331 [Lentithecium fluviatile CBS 122367]